MESELQKCIVSVEEIKSESTNGTCFPGFDENFDHLTNKVSYNKKSW